MLQLRVCRLANGAGRLEGTLGHRDFGAQARQPEKGALDTENNLLMLAVEAQVGGQQALLGRVQGIAPPPEVQEQPTQIQGGDDLLEIRAKEPAGRDVFGGGTRLTLVAPKRREREHRKVSTFHQSNA